MWERLAGVAEKPFQRARELWSTHFGGNGDEDALRVAFIGLIKAVLAPDRPLSDRDLEAVRHLLREHSPHEISQMLEMLRVASPLSAAEAAEQLKPLGEVDKRRALRGMVILSISSGRLQQNTPLLEELAERFGISRIDFLATVDELVQREERRRKILKSGAGIAVALGVILVFILTATLLRSVILGLIFAYIMLPVEKYFERRITNRRHLYARTFKFFSELTGPLRNLSHRLSRGTAEHLSEAEEAAQQRKHNIGRAVSLTCVSLLAALIVLVGGLGYFFSNYVNKLKNVEVKIPVMVQKVEKIADNAGLSASATVEDGRIATVTTTTTISKPALEKFFAPVLNYIDGLRKKFDRMPLVQSTLAELSRALNDETAQRELAAMLLRRTGGFVSFAAGLIGTAVAFLLDLLLTIFFFLLFLTKLAEFCAENNGAGRQSDYLVRTVFNGNWLPGANEEILREGGRIIGEVINKLKVWLRGYLSLVLLDSTVYTTVFYFLHVPYFFILGPLAGCGILLPFIGPIASAILTILVTLAVGGSSVATLQILGIISAYLIYNGIIEQFILYPMVIGESLGLSTLETIIVVLLGGIFAGVPGMIFAIPAAAVLKYLVPQIYHCFDNTAPKTEK